MNDTRLTKPFPSPAQASCDDDCDSLDLFQLCEGTWLKLPVDLMSKAGQAAQTFGGLLQITSGETFVKESTIAAHARLPLRTAKSHLKKLTSGKWLDNMGRQPGPSGRARRTCTFCLTPKAREALKRKQPGELTFGVLPLWACHGGLDLPWGGKAVLSILMARLMSLKKIIDEADGAADMDPSDYWGSIAIMDTVERPRFQFSVRELGRLTGLGVASVVAAKKRLADAGIVRRSHHELWPNPEFRVPWEYSQHPSVH
jgi:hypothetical protein